MDVCNSDYGKNLGFGKTEVYVDGDSLSIAGTLFQITAPQNVANHFVLRGTDEPIRALSWKQPFATLMLKGKIETRTWSTKYRGWVLICASAQPYTDKQIKEISGKGKGFMGKEWDAFVPQPVLWKECYRVLKPGGHLLSFFGTRTYDYGTLAIRLAGFDIRDCIQWIYGSGFPKSKKHLKPANEPICVARKPGLAIDLNIDECRIKMQNGDTKGLYGSRENAVCTKTKYIWGSFGSNNNDPDNTTGRWPSNVIFDFETAALLDSQSGIINTCDNRNVKKQHGTNGMFTTHKPGQTTVTYNDIGGASRFFYIAKPSPSERKGNMHTTVKPVKLMEQLVKLYCLPGGTVLDPHMGSGTTGVACKLSGRSFIGIDNDKFSYDIAKRRIEETNPLFNH